MLTFASHFSLKLLFHIYQVGFVRTMQHSREHFSKMSALVRSEHTAKFIIDISCHWLTTIREIALSTTSFQISNAKGLGVQGPFKFVVEAIQSCIQIPLDHMLCLEKRTNVANLKTLRALAQSFQLPCATPSTFWQLLLRSHRQASNLRKHATLSGFYCRTSSIF